MKGHLYLPAFALKFASRALVHRPVAAPRSCHAAERTADRLGPMSSAMPTRLASPAAAANLPGGGSYAVSSSQAASRLAFVLGRGRDYRHRRADRAGTLQEGSPRQRSGPKLLDPLRIAFPLYRAIILLSLAHRGGSVGSPSELGEAQAWADGVSEELSIAFPELLTPETPKPLHGWR